jgi:hypothetical protein
MVGSFLRMTVYGAVNRSLMGAIKKAPFCKEWGLKNLMIIVPLPYAGIIQVRYKGRPIGTGHLSENAPLAL